jgi:hypothetical protein
MPTTYICTIIVSTVLNLVIVPSFFLIMDDLSRVLGWVFGRMVGRKEAEPEEPPAHELAARLEARAAEIAALETRVGSLEESVGPRRGTAALHVAE